MTHLRIGTRTSTLAMWQANTVSQKLIDNGFTTEIVGISSKGDLSLSGDLAKNVGQFIHAIDAKLLDNTVDISVHSCKDVPVQIDESIRTLAYLERGQTSDVLVFAQRDDLPSLQSVLQSGETVRLQSAVRYIPKGGMIGTVSGRRQSFILSERSDLIPVAVRGQIETRLKRLSQGRADALILAEVGLQRLFSIGALEPWMLEFSALRIDERDWPTAPGQGAISVHCHADGSLDEIDRIRTVLNDPDTETDVEKEKAYLDSFGGGCLYPAGIKVHSDNISVQVSPSDWRESFCTGYGFSTKTYSGPVSEFTPVLPKLFTPPPTQSPSGRKIISTLNSDRLANVLQNGAIDVMNLPVLELSPLVENWPSEFIDESTSRSHWPYLILTSPFAAKCAIEVAKHNGDINRIQWLAIGEGTARACFRRGVTVSICAQSRNSSELIEYIDRNLNRETELFLPRSSVASPELEASLERLGFDVRSWVGYQNASRKVEPFELHEGDALLLSSPSSAHAWVQNSLPVPKNILCMGKASREAIESLPYFQNATVEILQGPTAEFIARWWKTNRGDD